MEPTTTPDPKCFRCDQPALTFDEEHRPLCGYHATIVLSAIRRKVFGDDADRSEEASGTANPKPATREYGFRLHLVPPPDGGPDGVKGESQERSDGLSDDED